MKVGKIEFEGGVPLDEFFTKQQEIIKDLSILFDNKSEIIEELVLITKNLNTRLSALEKAVEHIEIDYTTLKSLKPIIACYDNLQEQVDILAKDLYEEEK